MITVRARKIIIAKRVEIEEPDRLALEPVGGAAKFYVVKGWQSVD